MGLRELPVFENKSYGLIQVFIAMSTTFHGMLVRYKLRVLQLPQDLKGWTKTEELKIHALTFRVGPLHHLLVCDIMKCTMCIDINCSEYTKLLIVSDHNIIPF